MKHRFDGMGGLTEEYKRGVDNFVQFAQKTKDKYGLIGCSCTKCKNLAWITEDEVKYHLYLNGIIEAYTVWDHHGEKINRDGHYDGSQNHVINEDDDMYDAFEILRDIGEQYRFNNVEEEPNKEAADFYKLVNDAFVPLYPNCEEHSKLLFVTKLLHFKNMYGCSQKGFEELLKLIRSVWPSPHTLPETYQNVKNMVRGLHLKYEKIDACENDCMLFYKEDVNQDKMSCPIYLGDVRGFQLKHGGKASYYGTSRVFLEPNDLLRKNNKYGSREIRSVKTRYSGTTIKNYCKRVKFYPHGKIKWRKPEDFGVTHNWTHMSMFWELPYWETLQLRHCLHIMHIEKNVFDNIFHTILNNDKTKDKEKSRKDCEHLKIRKELWIHPDGTISQAPYALTRDRVDKLCKWVKELELPDGCSSNIARCCKEDKRTFKDVATLHNRLQRNEVPQQNHYPHFQEAYTYPTNKVGREKQRYLTDKEMEIVKYYVLINMPEVKEYLAQFEELTYKKKPDLDPTILEAYAKKKFISWFERRVGVKPDHELHEKFKVIIEGPFRRIKSYPGCKCNGFKFLCAEPGQYTSPNSGVYVQGKISLLLLDL
ncbi:hypothetical protein AgCh_019815 [Apium graveolens]